MKGIRGQTFSAKLALEDAIKKCKEENAKLKAEYEENFKKAASLKSAEAVQKSRTITWWFFGRTEYYYDTDGQKSSIEAGERK